MQCRAYTDFEAFAAVVLPWLAGEPVGNNVSVHSGGWAHRREAGAPSRTGPGWSSTRRRRSGSLGVATVTPPGGALLEHDAEPGRRADRRARWPAGAFARTLPFVVGPIEASAAFARRFTERTGRHPRHRRSADLPAAVGDAASARTRKGPPATDADRDLLVAWSVGVRGRGDARPSQGRTRRCRWTRGWPRRPPSPGCRCCGCGSWTANRSRWPG